MTYCLYFQFDECFLRVNIIDLNDNAPEFSKTSYTFTAKRETNYIAGQVTVRHNLINQKVLIHHEHMFRTVNFVLKYFQN